MSHAETTGGTSPLWHYTIQPHYARIAAEGQITPSSAYGGKGAPAVVWFSSCQDWDPMVAKSIECADGSRRDLGRDEMQAIGVAPIRIGVRPEAAPYDWHGFKRKSGIAAKLASRLVSAAVARQSRPSWWFATFDSVPRSEWQAVEQWDGWRWVSVPGTR